MTTESLPFGTVTFLFTDIEGSTTLWERYGEAMRPALARHDALLRSAVFANDGRVVKTTGDGIHAVFSSGVDGLHAALQAQRELCAQDWSDISPDRIHVRMGLHTGEAEQREGDYYGTHVNRAARLMSIGHGDQILLSGFTASLVQEALTTDLNLRDLGDHSLRGLAKPERVFQVVVADLPADFPALRSSTVFVGNLPTRVTSFVGRTREIALIRERLHQTRLLTLTGPGGTGKTSLSLRVANDVQAEYEHGVWFVELAPISNPDLVPPAVFTALGLTNAPGIQIDQVLFDYLREKHALLILDNCEHLIESAARLSADLIAGCPQLTILASSREGLGVYGETTIHLPTLTLPDPQTATVEDARLSEAVQLFVERASAVQSSFVLTDENAPYVSQIVRRLDGIPLAIELAAARMTVFGVEQIAARLDNRFRLLTGGSRTALPRQQTLRALIDWSYDLLDEEERALLRRLSVFKGGWTFDAAEYVGSELDVYTLLPQLINKSLVVVAESPTDAWGETETDAEPRYTYLETIRQYARDRLFETAEVEESRDRHFDYYDELTSNLDYGSGTAAQLLSRGHLILERDNLQSAVEWGLERYPDRVLDLCWNMVTFLADQNPGGEGIQWVEMGLEQLERRTPANDAEAVRWRRAWLKGKVTHGLLAMFLGELSEASQVIKQVVDPLRAGEGDQIWLASALFVQAQCGYFLEDPRTGDYVAETKEAVGKLKEDIPIKKPILALALLVEALFENRQSGVVKQELLDEATAIISQTGNEYYLPWIEYIQMSLWRSTQMDPDVIIARLAPSLERLRRNRSYRVAEMLESDYAHILRERGRLEEAAEIYRRTIHQWQKLGHRAAVANQLECLAFIYRVWHRPELSVELLGAAEQLREATGQPMLASERTLYDAELAALKEGLDPTLFAQLWTEGRTLSTDTAVKLAIAPLAETET